MKLSKTQIALFVALLLSNAIILYVNLDWTWLRLPAAWALTFVLPGWAWLAAIGWLQTDRAIERIVLVSGFSLTLSSLALLITVLLPGPFTETPVIITLNLVTLAGLLFQLPIFHRRKAEAETHTAQPLNQPSDDSPIPPTNHPTTQPSIQPTIQPTNSPSLHWPSRPVLLILIAIVAVGAFTRLTRLGYAEFHEDELENMRLIVRAYKGEEYVPFIDSKGPIHWLLPAALWYANGWINEGIARTPFALASILLIPAMYMLGRRMSNEREYIGLIAAGVVALNGFFASLARHVENRSLIVFWGALAVWLAYRYYRENRPNFLIYLALTLAIALIAHPTVLLYLPVIGFIIAAKLWRDGLTRAHALWLAGGLALVGAGLASLTLVGPSTAYPRIGGALFVVGAGLGLAYTVANDLIVAGVAPGRVGAAAAISETAYELGMALGIATLGSVVAAVYRGLTVPPGVHAGVAAQAKQTLGGANQAAAMLPADQADQLLTAARGAFTDGLIAAAGVGSALLLASATVVWLLLKPTPQPGRVSPCSKVNTLSGS